MRRSPKRRRLLISAAGLALVAWAVDATLRGGPTEANAQSGAADGAARQSVRWHDVSHLIARYSATQYQSLATELHTLDRDLFAPTPRITATLFDTEPEQDAQAALEAAERAAAFSDVHRLSGVVLGGKPLAVIDGRVVRPGGRVDGHRLLEVRREQVLLRNEITGQDVVLRMRPNAAETPTLPVEP